MKTISLKKVSAVAVASLGFGLLSVVPVQAAATLPIWVDTATTVGGVAITANTSTVTRTLNTDVDAAAVASITAPAGASVIFAVKSGAAFLTTDIIDLSINGVVVASGSPASAATTATLAARTLPTPSVTTTYTYSLKVYANATGAAGTQRTTAGIISDIPVSVTVVAPTGFSAATSTARIGASTLSAADTQALTSNDEVRVSSAAATNGAMIGVKVNNTSGTAFTGGSTLSVQVLSGPGLVKFGASTDNYAAIGDATVRADSLALAAGTSAANIAVTADGTNGTSEIQVRVLDSVTGAVLGTLPTVKAYFFGAPATVEVSQKYKYIAGSGSARGCSNATSCIEDTFANSAIAVVTVKDSGGNLVTGATVSGVISDGTVISATTLSESTVKTLTSTAAAACTAGTGSCNGLGTYLASVTGAVGAASGKTATVTYRALVSGTTFVTATPVTYTIGGAVATETLALSKPSPASYSPGEAMTVTRTAKDSAGNVPYDGQTANGVTFSKPQGGTAPTASWYVSGAKTSGANSLFAPVAGGAFNALMTSSVDGVTVITAAGSVTDGTAALVTQLDALNAKIVALNALIAKIMKKLGVK